MWWHLTPWVYHCFRVGLSKGPLRASQALPERSLRPQQGGSLLHIQGPLFQHRRPRGFFPERSSLVSCVRSRALPSARRGLPPRGGICSPGTWCVFWENCRGGGGDPERGVVNYWIFPDLTAHLKWILSDVCMWKLFRIHWDAEYCSVTAEMELPMVMFWLPVCIMLFPRAYSVRIPVSCSIILEAVGSTFYEIVLRRNLDKTVIINITYIWFSLHQLYFIGWYYYWKVEPLMSKFNIEISFILWDLDTRKYKMEVLTWTEAKAPFVGLGVIFAFGGLMVEWRQLSLYL